MDMTVAVPRKPLRLRAIAIGVASILALGSGGWVVARWVINAREDPYARVPELGLRVFDYVQLPSLGQVYRVGDTDVVLMSTVVLEDGGTALHFVLRREAGLPRYNVRLTPTDRVTPQAGESTDTCGASGRTGWGECYIRVPQAPGDIVTLNLMVNLDSHGSFDVTIPNPDGSGV